MTLQEDLAQAVSVLREGGIILYPTDTVWGIGCDATNQDAVRRIYELKRREDSKSMLVLLDGAGKLQGYVQEVPSAAWDLLDTAVKPMTIIYPGAKNFAPNLVAEDGSIGIRITSEIYSKSLCERLHRPLVSTSANISGEKTARMFSEITKEILEGVDYVAQYRRDDKEPARPSSIIKLGLHNEITIIRK